VKEEISEFEDEAKAGNQDRMEAELGDVLFAIVNAARLYHLIPDNALERTNQKFIARFTYLEQRAKEQGRLLDEMTLDEMEAIWQESKKLYK
jgi:XTP/dITP diphosphohydrolase